MKILNFDETAHDEQNIASFFTEMLFEKYVVTIYLYIVISMSAYNVIHFLKKIF
jgi:cell division protein FtsL